MFIYCIVTFLCLLMYFQFEDYAKLLYFFRNLFSNTARPFILSLQLFFFRNIIKHVFHLLSEKAAWILHMDVQDIFEPVLLALFLKPIFNNHKPIETNLSKYCTPLFNIMKVYRSQNVLSIVFLYMNPVKIRSSNRCPQCVNTCSIGKFT